MEVQLKRPFFYKGIGYKPDLAGGFVDIPGITQDELPGYLKGTLAFAPENPIESTLAAGPAGKMKMKPQPDTMAEASGLVSKNAPA